MASWTTLHERPSIHIDPPAVTAWPQSEQDSDHDPNMPWRLQKYDHRGDIREWGALVFHSEHEASYLPAGVLRSMETLGQLGRFTDAGQTRFKGRPNRDGTNINETLAEHPNSPGTVESNGSADLRLRWERYADILRAIHREGQMKGGVDKTWIYEPLDQLEHMINTFPKELKGQELARLHDGGPLPNNTVVEGSNGYSHSVTI